MTEKEFEAKIEAAADRLECSIEKKWEKRPIRYVVKSVSLLAEAGLLFGGGYLAKRGHTAAAAWCIGLGALGLAAEIITLVVFRRK